MVLLKAMFIYILYTIKIHDFSMFVRDFVDFSLSERVFKETWMAFGFLKILCGVIYSERRMFSACG